MDLRESASLHATRDRSTGKRLISHPRQTPWQTVVIEFHFQIDSSLDLSDSFITDVQLHVMEIDGYSVSRPFHENANYHLWQSLNYEHAKGKPARC